MPPHSPSRSKHLPLLSLGLFALALASPRTALAEPDDAPKPETPPAEAPPAETPPAETPSLSKSLTGMAKAEFEAGKVLFQDKDFANAIVKFERAYELSHDPRLLWNIALCQKNLRRYTRMMTTLGRYREDKSPLITDQDRKDASSLIETVKAFISPLTLSVSEPGARIFVDGEEVGKTPLSGPILLDVGKRKIRITKAGFKDQEKTLEVAGGGELSLSATLEKDLHRGRLLVAAGADDLIAIDGKAVGRARWEGVLPSGGHTLRVSAPGMAIYQSEVTIQDDQLRRVEVTLNPLPKSNLGTILWITAGVALTAGAAIGGAFLFQPTEAPAPLGTLGTQQLSFGGIL